MKRPPRPAATRPLGPVRVVLLCAVIVLGVAMPPSAAAAQTSTVRIGMIFDGPWDRNSELRHTFESEIRALIRDEFDLRFPDELLIEADFTLPGVARAVDRLLADQAVDVLLTLGPVASTYVGRLAELPKPVIAAFVLNPELQGLPVEPDAEGLRVSGRRNLSYVTFGSDFPAAIMKFRELVPFRELTLLNTQALLDAIPELSENLRQQTAPLNLELRTVGVGASADEALAALQPDAEAVYVTPLLQLAPSEFDRLVAGLTARRLPAFSFLGRSEVQRGLLASIYLDTDFVRLGRRLAITLQRILSGDDAGSIPVEFERAVRLTINVATSRAVGVYPSWSLFTEAELINDMRPGAQPLTLVGAVQEAVAANLDLVTAEQEVLVGQQAVREARAPLLPQLAVTGAARVIDRDRASAGFGGQPQRLVSGSATVSQLLYSEPARANASIQRDVQRTRELARDQIRLDTILEAAVAYLDVLRARTFERIQRENLGLTRSNLELAQARQQIGVARASEVIRWENEIASNRRSVIDANAARNQAEIALNRARHHPLEEPFDPAEAELDDPVLATGAAQLSPYVDNPFAFDLFRDFMSLEAASHSPELGQLDAAIAAQERQVLATRRAFWAPTVTFQGDLTGYQASGTGSPEALAKLISTLPFGFSAPNSVNWTLGLSASLPLFTGGGRRAARDGATEELARLRLERAVTAERIEQRVRSALHQAGASFAGIALAQSAADAAHRNLDLVTDAYTSGAVSILDLLDAQRAARVADEVAATAVYDYLVDLMQVERAMGRFDFFTDPGERQAFLDRLNRFFVNAGYRVRVP